jgi:hypothetical protein
MMDRTFPSLRFFILQDRNAWHFSVSAFRVSVFNEANVKCLDAIPPAFLG